MNHDELKLICEDFGYFAEIKYGVIDGDKFYKIFDLDNEDLSFAVTFKLVSMTKPKDFIRIWFEFD